MTWIRNVMNRLFDKNKNEDFEENYEELDIEEIEEEEHTEKPAFRFPIITDAEIYGWEPDPENERKKADNLITELDDDDFVPVPLYKNERWPGGNEKTTIHRATSPNKYNLKQEKPTVPTKKRETAISEEKDKEASKTAIVQKKSNRPFTPTNVPSPVFGYLRPKQETVEVKRGKEEAATEEVAVKSPNQDEPTQFTAHAANEKVVAGNEIDRIDLDNHAHTFDKEEQTESLHEQTTKWNSETPNPIEYDADSMASELPQMDERTSVEVVKEEQTNVVEEPSDEAEDLVIAESEVEQTVSEDPDLPNDVRTNSPMIIEKEMDLLENPSSTAEEEIELSENLTVPHETIEPGTDLQHPVKEEIELTEDHNTTSHETIEPVADQQHTVNEEIELTEDHNTTSHETIDPVTDQQHPVKEEIELTENHNTTSHETIEQSAEKKVDQTENPTSITVDAEASPVQEQKKERIVPFNVLMLKNDKLKYEEREKKSITKPVSNSTDHAAPKPPLLDMEAEGDAKHDEPDVELETEPYYAFPSQEYLIQPEEHVEDTDWLQSQSEKLEEALSYFAVQANVIEAVQGPTVTRFELTVGHGTKVSKVRNLTDDLKLALAAEDIRIQAPIPGTSSIGIEIPNRKPRAVRISEVIETKRFQESDSPLEAVLGLSLTGEPVTLDLRKMPHGMIAGATGSGKSVCINSILISLLYKASPADLKMLLIDPKMVELAPFNGIPHLLSPVITDVKAATAALKWAVAEMERRYELFAHVGARNIERYNEMAEKDRKFSLKLPYLLIVIDELADLMMMAPADVEVSIGRITQKARACGIHLIIATQRPSVDVITGTIKANVPTRVAFSVSSQIDSRTIIDTPGAERLLGKGDMLYLGNGQSSAMRLQGTFVTDAEIERIIEHVQNEAEPDYLFGQEDLLANIMEEEESDPLFSEACKFIIAQGSASTSLLQRNFSIGYNRAAKLMDRMEKLGFISEQRGSKAREVYVSENELNQFLNSNEKNIEM